MRIAKVALSATLIAGCLAVAYGQHALPIAPYVPVAPQRAAMVEQWLQAKQRPLPVKPIAMWYAGNETASMICGEIEAPEALRGIRPTLRYVYYVDGTGGFIELHELFDGTVESADAVLVEGRRIFTRVWGEHCLWSAPANRIMAALFSDAAADDRGTDTPLTNAYADQVLDKDPDYQAAKAKLEALRRETR